MSGINRAIIAKEWVKIAISLYPAVFKALDDGDPGGIIDRVWSLNKKA